MSNSACSGIGANSSGASTGVTLNSAASSSKGWRCLKFIAGVPFSILRMPLTLVEKVITVSESVNVVAKDAVEKWGLMQDSKALQGAKLLASWSWTLGVRWPYKAITIPSTFLYNSLDRIVPDSVPLKSLLNAIPSALLGYKIYERISNVGELIKDTLSEKVSTAIYEPAKVFIEGQVSPIPVIGPAVSHAFSFGAGTVSNWTSFRPSALPDLASNLAYQITKRTGSALLEGVVNATGELKQVVVNAAASPLGTAMGVSSWGFNMFSNIVGSAVNNGPFIASSVASLASIVAIPALFSASIYYIKKPGLPPPEILHIVSAYQHKPHPGFLRKYAASGSEYLSRTAKVMGAYAPDVISKWASFGMEHISAFLSRKPQTPVEICVNEHALSQITKSIENLKEGNPQHLMLIEPQGNERRRIMQHIRAQTECNYIPLDAATLSRIVNYSVSSSTEKKNAVHLMLFEDIKQLVRNSPLPTILHMQGFENLCSTATNSYGQENTDAISRAYQEVLSILKQMMREEKQLMIIGETTHPKQIDSDFKYSLRSIQIHLPDEDTRVKILRRAINEQLTTIPERESCLNEEAIATIAKRTPGFSSDLLERLINDLKWERRSAPNQLLTEKMVKRVTNQAIVSYYSQLEGKKPQLANQFHPFNVPILEGDDKEVKKNSPPPVFNKKLQTQIDDIVKWTKNILSNEGDMQNLLLYGAAGTGKTMIAEKIAKESGFNYISINGGDLAQFIQEGTHLTALNELFTFVKDATEPTILFIDEMDVFAADRKTLDQPRREILNAFLAQTGTPSNHLMIIGTTNCMETMDSAVLSRMSNKLHIALPEYGSRLSILTNLINEKMGEIPERQTCLNDEAIELLAKRTKGLAGRTLRALVTKLQAKRDTTADRKLTIELIEEVTHTTLVEELAATGKKPSWWRNFRYFTWVRVQRACRRGILG